MADDSFKSISRQQLTTLLQAVNDKIQDSAAPELPIIPLGPVGANAAAAAAAAPDVCRSEGPRILTYSEDFGNGQVQGAGLIYSSPYYKNKCWQVKLQGNELWWRSCANVQAATPSFSAWSADFLRLAKTDPDTEGAINLILKFAPSDKAISTAQGIAPASALADLVHKDGDKGLSTHDFNNEWLTKLANAGVYARQDNNRHAINGIFALTKDASDEQIRAALTCFETKKVLTATDLIYCAENGSPLWDEATQGLVWVTHNGGNLFNLIELSMTNYTELPRLRFASIRFNDSTSQWSVTRPGQQERIAYHSERPALATPSTDGLLSAADKSKLDAIDATSIPDGISTDGFLKKFKAAEWIHDDAIEYLRLTLSAENPEASEDEIESMVNEYWSSVESEVNAEIAFQIKVEMGNYRAQLAGEELDLEALVNNLMSEMAQFGVSMVDFENRMSEKADTNHSHSGYASYSHTHSASNITSGTLDIKRIPTGTDSQTVALGNHTHSGYASSTHTHSEYAALKHVHTEYATESHSHTEYAPLIHEHNQYASTSHTHSEYAPLVHEHDDYAPLTHSHSEYALTAHSHTLTTADIPSLPASKINSGTFSTSQIPSLAASKITSGTFSDARMPTSVIGKTTTSSISSLPSSHALIVASISASATFRFSSIFAAGRQVHTIIKNTGSSDITVTMPSSDFSYLCDVETLTIPAGKFAEVNAISDGSTIYLRSVI